MRNRGVYNKGIYRDLEVLWADDDGELVDLTGLDITLSVFPFGGPEAFAKNTGITIPPLVDGDPLDPNLTVQWSAVEGEELDSLAPGTYVMKFTTSDDRELYAELVMRLNAPNVGYCEIGDLLLGDLTISARINKYDYINTTADEMNAEIGQRYALPLNLDLAPAFVAYKLKTINAKLATGRLIMAQAIAKEDSQLNAYALAMVNDALKDLREIKEGDVVLPGLTLSPVSYESTAPSIKHRDTTSAVESFENMFMRSPNPLWGPGA